MAVRITIDGKLALTVDGLAERYGLAPKSISAIISRGAVAHDAMLDGKKKIYLAARFDAIMRARPGKGVNLRGLDRAAQRCTRRESQQP